MHRRLSLIALFAGAMTALPAAAQDGSGAKPIQLIVPAPGGSGTGDAIARVLAEELAK